MVHAYIVTNHAATYLAEGSYIQIIYIEYLYSLHGRRMAMEIYRSSFIVQINFSAQSSHDQATVDILYIYTQAKRFIETICT